MEEPAVSPVIVILLFLLRCMIPLGIMLGVSYVLRRLGLLNQRGPAEPTLSEGNNAPAPGEPIHG